MKKLLFIIFLFFSYTLDAQILNIERYRLEKDTAKSLLVKVKAGLNVYNRSAAADAPVNLFGYNWNVNAMYHTDKHAFVFVSNFDYLRINQADFLNFGLLHGRAIYNHTRPLNFETFIQYSYDNFRGLDPRWIYGGTFRYKAVRSERLTLVLGLGALYERERWWHPYDEETLFVDFVKSSNYASLRWTVNEYVDINTVNYYQVGYDKSIGAARHRVSGSVNLNTKITDRFSFNNSFDYSYEDRPIVPITNFIFAFKSGIAFDF